MIARDNNISLALGIPGLILQVAGRIMMLSPGNETIGTWATLVGTALLIGGLAMYAKAKGRSPVWGLMGLFSIIGLIVLAMLKDRAPNAKSLRA